MKASPCGLLFQLLPAHTTAHPPSSPPIGLSQVKGLHSARVPLQLLEAFGVEIQVPGIQGQT